MAAGNMTTYVRNRNRLLTKNYYIHMVAHSANYSRNKMMKRLYIFPKLLVFVSEIINKYMLLIFKQTTRFGE